jgi:hypothetical protein
VNASSFIYLAPGERQALVRGPMGFWLKQIGVPAMWSRTERGWWVRAETLPDLMARADLEGINHVFRDYRAPRPRPPR